MSAKNITEGVRLMLSERQQKILAAVVEQYIATGEPVGSKLICDKLDVSVSSATVRNEMAQLSSDGYLDQPHTSAGRIPTQKGYRYYVDNLLQPSELDVTDRKKIEGSLDSRTADPSQILSEVGEALVNFSNCAALSTTPADESAVIKTIEMVGVSRTTALIVLLTSTGIIKSKPCRCETPVTQELKECFDSIVKEHFIGKHLGDVGTVMIQTLAASLGADALSMSPLLITVADLAQSAGTAEVMLEGQSNLLGYSDYGDEAPQLLNFLSNGEPLGSLVNETGDDDVEIFIGSENKFRELKDSTMIISKYKIGDSPGGAIGIIGPTRLNYSKLIPSIRYLADMVSKMLSDVLKEDNDGTQRSDGPAGTGKP